jgi:class 3 adenylate cyclase
VSSAEATFLFADIAGFTALTEAHGDEQALQLVEEFASAVQAELPRVGGEHIRRSATPSCCGCPILAMQSV